MKICILSMQKVNNFGSLLQCYSLMKILISLGHEVSFIDIEPNSNENALINHNQVQFIQNDKEYSRITVIRYCKKIDKYFIKRVVNKIKFNSQYKTFDEFRKDFLHINDFDNNKTYDYCVIGSDEVFNCVQQTSWGYTSQLYGNVSQAKNVITYAASCGYATVQNVPEAVQDSIRAAFKRISFFSVRDVNTYNFVSDIMGQKKEIHYNLDPALIGDFNEEINKYGTGIKLPEKYCLIYAYADRISERNEIASIIHYCRRNGYTIVSMGQPQKWSDDFIVANPFQLLYAFQKAQSVITDTFHGTIFSYKYAKHFAVLMRESNKQKLGDLVSRLSIERHVVKSFDQLTDVIKIEEDIDSRKSGLDKEYANALEYLKTSIS